MTAQFAGSRSLDDRRRRRLAQESEVEVAICRKKGTQHSGEGSVCDTPVAHDSVRSDVVSDESLIPQALWKVVLYGCAGFAFWSMLIWLNLSFQLGHDWQSIISPAGRAFSFFSLFSLLISSQLCFTIWWYRSRSRKDFGGRYRVWGWAGCFWSIACLSSGLGIHQPLAQLAYQAWPIYAWRPELLYWLTPFAIGVLAIHQLIAQDMRQSRVSRVLWNTSLLCGCLAAGSLFGLEQVVPVQVRELFVVSVVSLWQFMISFTLLCHARFVVHVTNEVAPARSWWHSRLKMRVLDRLSALSQVLRRGFEFRAFRSSEKRQAKAILREQKKEARAILRAEKKLKLENAREEKKLARELAKAEKAEVKRALQEEKAASKQAQNVAASQNASASRGSEDASVWRNREEAQGEPLSVAPGSESPRTTSGRKRKRVLGSHHRSDSAQEASAPHFRGQAGQSEVSSQGAVGDYDDYDEFESEGGEAQQMSRKQRRKARKGRDRAL